MNSIMIWNDEPPANSAEIVSYAHDRGIEVIFAFHWGWGTTLDLTRAEDRRRVRDDVIRKYARDYNGLGHDGIYFQTQTEHGDTELAGRSTAAWAVELVNDTGAALLDRFGGLALYFGLHATSVRERYRDLAALDPRIPIVWEDAGATPFPYEPGAGKTTAEETLDYAKALSALRPQGEFAMVAKGWTSLAWGEEFEHHGPFVLGERDRDFTRARLAARQPRWDMINTLWRSEFPVAARFYREMLAVAGGGLSVWGLVEDGLFEEAVQPSVALFAETLWDPARSDTEIAAAAESGYWRATL